MGTVTSNTELTNYQTQPSKRIAAKIWAVFQMLISVFFFLFLLDLASGFLSEFKLQEFFTFLAEEPTEFLIGLLGASFFFVVSFGVPLLLFISSWGLFFGKKWGWRLMPIAWVILLAYLIYFVQGLKMGPF